MKLSQKKRDAIADYTGDKFQDINDALRGESISGSNKEISDLLDDTLDEAPKHEGASFRTVRKVPAELVDQMKVGGVITDKAFQSSRAKPNLTTRSAFLQKTVIDGSLVMRIEGKNGVNISGLSSNPAESEILFPRNTKFKVNKIEKTGAGGWVAEVSEE